MGDCHAQGVSCKDVRELLRSPLVTQAIYATLRAHQKPTASGDLPEAPELARRLQAAGSLEFVRTCRTRIVHLASGHDAARTDIEPEVNWVIL